MVLADEAKSFTSIEAFVPRGLVDQPEVLRRASTTYDGLSAVRINWNEGFLSSIEPIEEGQSLPENFILPRFVEPHAHLDKAFSWSIAPNFSGTYEGALKANLKEHQSRTYKDVYSRSEKALRLALKNGIRAIRTHIDSIGLAGQLSWEALLAIRSEWDSLIDIQLVALVPLDFWNTEEGWKLASRIADVGGILGGVVVPPFENKKVFRSLCDLINIANQLGCGIDLHIDESSEKPALGLIQLIKALDSVKSKVPITCSHASSMGLLNPARQKELASRLASHEIRVVALPLTNKWLLGRKLKNTPVLRPFAPVSQLQSAGVTVAIGGDNVQDSWFPLGGFDPLALIANSLPIAQLSPWTRLGLSPFTTSPSYVLGLEWDGVFRLGSPADFVLLKSSSWSEALGCNVGRKVFIQGEIVE